MYIYIYIYANLFTFDLTVFCIFGALLQRKYTSYVWREIWHILQVTSIHSSSPSKIALTSLFIATVSCGKVVKCPRKIKVQQLKLYTGSTELRIRLFSWIRARKQDRAGQMLTGRKTSRYWSKAAREDKHSAFCSLFVYTTTH
jgi:hypothetical protein